MLLVSCDLENKLFCLSQNLNCFPSPKPAVGTNHVTKDFFHLTQLHILNV